MAMKLLKARELADAFKFVVHIDTSKVLEDGSPDGNYVSTFFRDKDFAERGLTKLQYLAQIKREIKLALRQGNGVEGTVLAGEGSEF
jgi:hypothetical protein